MKRLALPFIALLLAACTTQSGSATPSTSSTASPSLSAAPSSSAGAWIIPDEPTGPALAGDPVNASDTDGVFTLLLEAEQDRYRAGQPLGIDASLTYSGPDDEITALGSGSGLIGFSVQRTSPAITISAVSTSDCRPYQLTRDAPVAYPFIKSGGFSADDPQASFYEAYFADEQLRLPAGEWTISAGGSFYSGGDCGDDLHELTASVTIIVEP